MPNYQARTREQLRVSVGYNLRALYVGAVTAVGAGGKADFKDTLLRGGDNAHNGKWIICTSGSNDGEIVRVSDYAGSTYLVAVSPSVVGANFAANDTYEMWAEAFAPALIHEVINQAIIEVTGRAYDPIEDITLFADGNQSRFDLSSSPNISVINRLSYRSSVPEKRVHDCSSLWTAGTNVTVALDTKLKKFGVASNKLTLAVGVAAGGVIAYKDITALNLSNYTHVEWWARCSKTTAASDLKLLLDDTAACASPIELLGFPILTADTWKFCRVALAKADEDTAIASVGIEDDVDIGAETVWIDDVRAVKLDEAHWDEVPLRSWSIDQENRRLQLTLAARQSIGYAALKIDGGDKPALLTTDAGVLEVADQYVIARATELALLAAGGGPTTDPDSRRALAAYWGAKAEAEKRALPFLVDARVVRG